MTPDEPAPPRSRIEYHRLALTLHGTASWFHQSSAAWLAPHGLSLQPYNLLRILRGQHPAPATLTLLQERMVDRMSNVSRLVERLRRKGWVERRTCPTDRRAVDVVISGAGLALLRELDASEEGWMATFETLAAAEAATLNRLLSKLCTAEDTAAAT